MLRWGVPAGRNRQVERYDQELLCGEAIWVDVGQLDLERVGQQLPDRLRGLGSGSPPPGIVVRVALKVSEPTFLVLGPLLRGDLTVHPAVHWQTVVVGQTGGDGLSGAPLPPLCRSRLFQGQVLVS